MGLFVKMATAPLRRGGERCPVCGRKLRWCNCGY